MKKRIVIVVLLLFFLYASSVGNYLQYEETYDKASLFGLINLLISSFLLMCIPIIWRIVNKKAFDYKKGSMICGINSLAMFILSLLCVALNLLTTGFVGGLGALLYYFINMNIVAENNPDAKYKNFKISK